MAGIYVHIPFCKSRCVYCDFYSQTSLALRQRYVDAVCKEAEMRSLYINERVRTIYIGGGTPSQLEPHQLAQILGAVGMAEEVTIEMNPDDVTPDFAEQLAGLSVNRVSMGAQTFNDERLRFLRRRHSAAQVPQAVRRLREAGIGNISVDLMYSLPDQTMDCLEQSIDDVVSLNVEHISLYSLTIEENTVFGKKGIKNLDEDTEADMYELIVQKLRDRGYIHYEVSNFARDGRISMHNMGYWNYDDFLGVSMGAAGKIGSNRYTNTRDLKRYLNEEDIRDENLYLKTDEMAFENIMMSLKFLSD